MAEDHTGPTIPANRRPNPALDFVPLTDAHAMAIRAFWRGVFFGAVGVAALGGLAGWLS